MRREPLSHDGDRQDIVALDDAMTTSRWPDPAPLYGHRPMSFDWRTRIHSRAETRLLGREGDRPAVRRRQRWRDPLQMRLGIETACAAKTDSVNGRSRACAAPVLSAAAALTITQPEGHIGVGQIARARPSTPGSARQSRSRVGLIAMAWRGRWSAGRVVAVGLLLRRCSHPPFGRLSDRLPHRSGLPGKASRHHGRLARR